jgi:hypothetical protein
MTVDTHAAAMDPRASRDHPLDIDQRLTGGFASAMGSTIPALSKTA